MSRSPTSTLARAFRDYVAVCREADWHIRPMPHPSQSTTMPSAPSPKNPDPVETNVLHQPLPASISPPTMPKLETGTKRSREELRAFIGKGSNFHRNQVQQYLKPLGYAKLQRAQDVRKEEYPEEVARKRHIISKSLENSRFQSSILHHLNSRSVQEIIELLVAITPRPRSRDEQSPISTKDTSYHHKSLGKHVYTEIPKMVDFSDNPEMFEKYIYQLTHSTFHYKNSSKFDGIIPKILRNLFHPLNTRTLQVRTTNSFNYLIHFFGRKHDFATCRELLVQMRIEHIKPNTTTYNLMLRNLVQLQKIQHMSDPLKLALKHLTQMKSSNLKANLTTWNTIFTLLPDERSKVQLTQKRAELNIPPDANHINAILQYLIRTREATTKQLLMYVNELGVPLQQKAMRTIVHRMIHEQQFNAAYRFLKSLKDQGDAMRPGVEDLNAFLVEFSSCKRVDLSVGMIHSFEREFGVKPDFDSYNLLMKAMAVSGHWKGKEKTLKVLYHKMMVDLKGVVAGDYWLLRLRSRLKFVYGHDKLVLSSELTDEEKSLKEMIDKHHFTNKIPISLDLKKATPEMKKTFKALGYYKSRFTKASQFEDKELTQNKEKAKKYRQKINTISIDNAMEKRIPYVEDPYEALRAELVQRRILDQ